jgi:hypothetical protein
MRNPLFCFILAGLWAAIAFNQETTLPVYSCPKINRPVNLTGNMDDTLWRGAPEVRLAAYTDGGPVRQATTVRLLYDGTVLFAGFRATDSRLTAEKTTRDQEGLWNDDNVELLLCPSREMHQYYEIFTNPAGVIFDACILHGRRTGADTGQMKSLRDYNAEGLTVKTDTSQTKARGYWTAEFAIPLASLYGNRLPRPGEEWRMNLYRTDYPAPEKPEYSAWSPVGTTWRKWPFHTPFRFGVLRFE